MNHKEILIEAITILNKYKQAGIEPVEFWGELEGTIHAKFQFNKSKCNENQIVLHFNTHWFDWNYKFDNYTIDMTKAKIPERLPEETKVILRLAFAIWEIMVKNEYI